MSRSDEESNTPCGDEALASKPIEPGEAVDLCNRVAAALNLANGHVFQDRNAWETLARTLAKRLDTFEEVSTWRLRAEEVGELGTGSKQSEIAPSVAPSDEWRSAALRLGEQLADTGPDNYYGMTPAQWLEWCENTVPSANTSSEDKPVAWLIVRHSGTGGASAVRHEVVLSPLTDDTFMDEGDEAWPLYRRATKNAADRKIDK